MTSNAESVSAPIPMAEILSALSYALDLTEGQPLGHSVRTCLLGMRLAAILKLDEATQGQLYYALLLKDAGCSSNAARVYQIFGADDRATKRDLKTTDMTRMGEAYEYLKRNIKPESNVIVRAVKIAEMALRGEAEASALVQMRCDRGAQIARKLGFPAPVSAAIHSLDEHWDGAGYPERLKGEAIPLFSRIAILCQTLEVFAALNGPARAFEVVRARSGTWFDPNLVQAAAALEKDAGLWIMLADEQIERHVLPLEPVQGKLYADAAQLDLVCEAFAEVVDAKSPFTMDHSKTVARIAGKLARQLQLPAETEALLRRAGLLHDLGKLGVPNTVLDKPAGLTPQEREIVKTCPQFTARILDRIANFGTLSFTASSIHERLDGSGYYRGLKGEQLPLTTRILALADVYAAMTQDRPHRIAMDPKDAVEVIGREVPERFCPQVFEALRQIAYAAKR